MEITEIIEAIKANNWGAEVAKELNLKSPEQVEEEIVGLKKKNIELIETQKKLKTSLEAEKNANIITNDVKNIVKDLNLEGVVDDNGTVDTVILQETLKDLVRSSNGSKPDVPKELEELRKDLSETKKEKLSAMQKAAQLEKEVGILKIKVDEVSEAKTAAESFLQTTLIDNQFKGALMDFGLPSSQAEVYSNFLKAKSKASIVKTDDGNYSAVCDDGVTSIQDWLKAFALSAEGKSYLPEPKISGGGASGGSSTKLKPYNEYSIDELSALRKNDPAAYARLKATK